MVGRRGDLCSEESFFSFFFSSFNEWVKRKAARRSYKLLLYMTFCIYFSSEVFV